MDFSVYDVIIIKCLVSRIELSSNIQVYCECLGDFIKILTIDM